MGDDSNQVRISYYLVVCNTGGKYRASIVNFITDILWMMFDCLPKAV